MFARLSAASGGQGGYHLGMRTRLLLAFALPALILGLLASGSALAQRGPTEIWLEPVVERVAAPAGSTLRAALQVTLQEGYHVNSDAPADRFLIPTVWQLEPPAGITVESLAYPEPGTLMQAGIELVVFGTQFVVGAEMALASDLAAGTYEVGGTFSYQACDDFACYAPTSEPVNFTIDVLGAGEPAAPALHAELFAGLAFGDAPAVAVPKTAADVPVADVNPADDNSVLETLERFTVAATAGGYMGEEPFLEFIDAAESGTGQRGWFDGRGPLAILGLILIGGLALNLTPCVLPMVPINLAIIGAGSQAGSRARGFALGGAYGLAMAAVYGVLGVVVILTAGTFGTINGTAWFNLGIAALFVVLALAMFDVLNIDFSRLQSKLTLQGDAGKGSFALAFGMGGMAALLAGACVAPVVIQVIVFASNLYATGTPVALALPFVLGVGMALPWPIAGAGLSALPKPGAWMVHVKHAFGVFILFTAVYYAWIGYGLVAQRWVDADEVLGSVAELAEEGWHMSLAAALREAETEGKPVLVDVWATWCKNCLTMDKTTLQHPDVKAALDGYVKVKFRAEDLNASPAREVMKRLGAVGLPAYGILTSDDATDD